MYWYYKTQAEESQGSFLHVTIKKFMNVSEYKFEMVVMGKFSYFYRE